MARIAAAEEAVDVVNWAHKQCLLVGMKERKVVIINAEELILEKK